MSGTYTIRAVLCAAVLFTAAAFGGCGATDNQTGGSDARTDDIVVLYTNDVHCAMDGEMGYAGLASYKESVQEATPYVTVVDCGDAIEGEFIGTISEGEAAIAAMNAVGYDFAVPGNHEFDYGMEQFVSLMQEFDGAYLGCNVEYTGSGDNPLSELLPYEIVTYGDTSVAYIGVLTPESLTKSSPAAFMEDGAVVYDFGAGEDGTVLYDRVQECVDRCRLDGADYVIVLSHLGVAESASPYRSTDLIAHTTGIDAVVDGHSHSVIETEQIGNAEGSPVLLSSTGSSLDYIGVLTIDAEGAVSAKLENDWTGKNDEVEEVIRSLNAQYEGVKQEVIAYASCELSIRSESGARLVRCRETNMGDFCADAYRSAGEAQIALINGGGIRAGLAVGDVTFGNVLDIYPFGNQLCVIEATGQQILDALEMAYRMTEPESESDGTAIGESNAFLQVSGIRIVLDPAIPTGVVTDANDMFVFCDGSRRVQSVEVLQEDGSYQSLDPEAVYRVATNTYLADGGDGFSMLTDCSRLIDEGMTDYEVLIHYISNELDGTIGTEYEYSQDRIVIRK